MEKLSEALAAYLISILDGTEVYASKEDEQLALELEDQLMGDEEERTNS